MLAAPSVGGVTILIVARVPAAFPVHVSLASTSIVIVVSSASETASLEANRARPTLRQLTVGSGGKATGRWSSHGRPAGTGTLASANHPQGVFSRVSE